MKEYIIKVKDEQDEYGTQKIEEIHDLIRCENCSHSDIQYGMCYCDELKTWTNVDFFCQKGEKK